MLAGLDAIAWDAHRDAYGAATGVPVLLRGLASARPELRQAALDNLYLGLCPDRRTVMEAAAVAVPFLWELAASPNVRERARVLLLLAHIVRASGEAGDVERARRAAWHGVSAAVALLEDDDASVRISTTYLLAGLAGSASAEAPAAALPALRQALCARREAERDERVASGVAFALGMVAKNGDAEAGAELRKMIDHPSRDVRLAAAVAIGEGQLRDPPERASMVLQTTLESADPRACWHGEPWGEGLLSIRLLDALRGLGVELAGPLLRTTLAKISSYAADALEPTLRAVFADRGPELSRLQRELLEVLVDNTAFWRGVSNGALLLARLGLPDSRQALRRLLGMTTPGTVATDENEARAILRRTLGQRDAAEVTSLDLSHVATDAVLALLPEECAQVVELTLQDCEISAGAWAAFAWLPHLKRARLAQSGVTDDGLANVARADSLEILGLGPCAVTDEGLAAVAKLASLRELTVHSASVHGAGARHLATLPLVRLHLGAALDDGCFEHLAAVSGIANLALRGRGLRGKGISRLRSLRALVSLDLRDTGFADEHAAELGALEALQSLTLFDTALTDAAVPALSKLARLEWLGLAQTQVSAEGRARLRQALPACRVLPDDPPDRT